LSFFSGACPASLLTGDPSSHTRSFKLWGTLDAEDAHLLVATGLQQQSFITNS